MKHYVVDEGWGINVFPESMFDEQGRYFEDRSINLADMDVIATFNNAEKAFEYAEELNDSMYN